MVEFIPLEELGDAAVVVTDYVIGMDLYQLRQKTDKINKNYIDSITEVEAAVIIKKIVQAVCEMHKENIIHRDLHLRNVMIHFKNIKPSPEGMNEPMKFYKVEMRK